SKFWPFLLGVLQVEITVMDGLTLSNILENGGTRKKDLLRFVNHLDGSDLGVIDLWRECEQQFALTVGAKSVKFANYGTEGSRRHLRNTQALKQLDAITGNVEDPTS